MRRVSTCLLLVGTAVVEQNIPWPSWLYARHLQLPLCLLVFQTVSTMPLPSLNTLLSASASSSEPLLGGRRKVSTCPFDRPTVRSGSVGCKAVVKTSDCSGNVHRFSNIAAD